MAEKSGIMLIATASHTEVKVWHTISGGTGMRHLSIVNLSYCLSPKI